MAADEARLIAFPPSVDTETARWILAHHGVTFREMRQSALGAALRTIWHRAKIPILFSDRAKRSPSRPIADLLDARALPERRLVPEDPALAAEVNALWDEFNGRMGVWVAQWIYHAVLAERELALRLMTDGVPAWQATLDRWFHGSVASGMRAGLGSLDAGVAAEALRRCKAVFDVVEARLADGRPYLTGDRFTLADAAFCACAAPLMLADVYGGTLPALEELPAPMQKEVLRFREHAAGRYAMRLYAERYRPRRAERVPAGFAIRRPAPLASLSDSLSARFPGSRLLRAGFALLRRVAPVARFGSTVVVTRHSEVAEVLERDGEFSVVAINGAKMDALNASFILGMDPGKRYQREKAWLDRCMLPEDLPRIRALVRTRCAELLDAAAPRGWIDIGGEYARVVAALLVQDYFGVPGPDTPTLMRWMRALFQDLFLNLGNDEAVHERALDAAHGLEEHFADLIQAERRSPGRADTVLARLVRLAPGELALGDDAIRRSLSGVIVGAVDTTNKAFCQALDQLLRRPNELAAAHAAASHDDVEEVGRVIFEALRFDPHNPIIVRRCPGEVRIGRERRYVVPAGSTVYAATLSAMFDPTAFENPGAFRTDRGTPYLHFGGGMHRCYGARINGVTLPELAAALLKRPPVRRAGWLRGRIHHDGPFPDRLEVRFGGG